MPLERGLTAHEAKLDLRVELDELDSMISDLKVRYDQYFTGLQPLTPDRQYKLVRRRIRELRKAPFKNSGLKFKLGVIENRFNTYNTYWQRVLREKEEGTYSKDVFKADLRQQAEVEERRAQTKEGASEKSLHNLYQSYKDALESQTGKAQDLDFKTFERSLIKRVKDLKEKTGGKKVSFKVVMQDGKVQLKAVVKDA